MNTEFEFAGTYEFTQNYPDGDYVSFPLTIAPNGQVSVITNEGVFKEFTGAAFCGNNNEVIMSIFDINYGGIDNYIGNFDKATGKINGVGTEITSEGTVTEFKWNCTNIEAKGQAAA